MSHDACAALCRLEETAAWHSAEDRRLRRAVAAQQNCLRALLLPSPHASAATALLSAAAQRRQRADALRAKALFAELWDRLVLRAWFIPVVLDGFLAGAMSALAALTDRLDAAARALSPARAVRFAAGGVVPSDLFAAPRPFAAAVALAVRVAAEFGEGRGAAAQEEKEEEKEKKEKEEEKSTARTAGFAGESVADALRIVAGRVGKDPRAAEFFSAAAAAPEIVSALSCHGPLRRAAAVWPFLDSTASALRAFYARAMRGFLQERARGAAAALVERRQQQERAEAQWRSQRAAAAGMLREMPSEVQRAAAVGPSGGGGAAFDVAECPLWAAVQGLRHAWE